MRDPLLEHIQRKFATPEQTKLATSSQPKASPLIERIQSRVKPAGIPKKDGLTAGGQNVGHQDVAPESAVDERDHIHAHRHVGSSDDPNGLRGPYSHVHEHVHAVRHDPEDGSVDSHEDRDHLAVHALLNDPEKAARLRDAADGHPDPRVREGARQLLKGVPASIGKRPPTEPAAAPLLSKATDTSNGGHIAQLIKEARHCQEMVESHRDFNVRQAARQRVKAIAAELREAGGMDDEAVIEKFAKGPTAAKSATAIVRKAVVAPTGYVTPELSKLIHAAVTKAIGDLPEQIRRLNERRKP